MEHSETTKVYKFNLSQYKKNTLKKLIVYSIFAIICATILFMSYITTFDSPFLFFLSLLLYIILLYFKVFKDFVAYLRANQTHKGDNITIQKENGQIVSIKMQLKNNKYDEHYSITSITELYKKAYIDIKGEITTEFTHSLLKDNSSYKTNLRIPPYFENMDEIYQELVKFKEQA